MDKGFQKLKQLENKLKELKAQKLENDIVLDDLGSGILSTNIFINNLKIELRDLERRKEVIETAPERYKQEKKNLIKIFSIVALITITVIAIISGIETMLFSKGISHFLDYMKITLGCSSVLFPIAILESIHSTKKNYKFDGVEEIKIKIAEKKKEIDSKSNELEKNISNYDLSYNLKKELDEQINEISNKITLINKVRSNVINEYCENNKELDDLLDSAYNKELDEKSVQKVKTNSN